MKIGNAFIENGSPKVEIQKTIYDLLNTETVVLE
jgi:hypothetical protein